MPPEFAESAKARRGGAGRVFSIMPPITAKSGAGRVLSGSSGEPDQTGTEA